MDKAMVDICDLLQEHTQSYSADQLMEYNNIFAESMNEDPRVPDDEDNEIKEEVKQEVKKEAKKGIKRPKEKIEKEPEYILEPITTFNAYTEQELNDTLATTLKKICKSLGISTAGVKKDLVRRLIGEQKVKGIDIQDMKKKTSPVKKSVKTVKKSKPSIKKFINTDDEPIKSDKPVKSVKKTAKTVKTKASKKSPKYNKTELRKMKLAELQEICRTKKLPVKGKKDDLIERLQGKTKVN